MTDQDSWFRRGLVEQVSDVEREQAKTPDTTLEHDPLEAVERD